MNMLAKAWNYQPAAEIRQSIKSRAVSAIVWLLALMLCFTLISRATASMTIPIVDTEKPSPATINHTVTVDGVLETARDSGVVAAGGAIVQEVAVKEGDTVASGDLLFTYDVKDFNRQIAQYQTDLGKIGASLKADEEQRALDEESRQRNRERAKEDLKVTGTHSDLDVQMAEERVHAAGERVRTTRETLKEYREEYGYDDEGDYTKEERERLRSEYNQAQIAYAEALLGQEKMQEEKKKAILDAQRTIEDTDRSATPSASAELAKLDAQAIQLRLAVLNEAVANKGEVYAPMDGVVTRVLVGAGTRTTDEAAVFINNSDTMNFVTEVSKDQKKYVNMGNTVKLRMAGETKDMQGLEITSVQPSQTEGFYRVTIEIPADYLPGTSGTVEIQQKSKSYETVVPLSALQADGSQFFVLKVRENDTSMGSECFAERVDVTVVEKNETYAAVTGAISSGDKIISSSKRVIGDGDRVRLSIKE